jgi:hypothetical protein
MGRCRCPTDQEMQCPVIGSLLGALAHHLRMNRSEHGTSAWIHYGHNDLRFARGVEHNSVALRSAACDLDELANAFRIHRHSVLEVVGPGLG